MKEGSSKKFRLSRVDGKVSRFVSGMVSGMDALLRKEGSSRKVRLSRIDGRSLKTGSDAGSSV